MGPIKRSIRAHQSKSRDWCISNQSQWGKNVNKNKDLCDSPACHASMTVASMLRKSIPSKIRATICWALLAVFFFCFSPHCSSWTMTGWCWFAEQNTIFILESMAPLTTLIPCCATGQKFFDIWFPNWGGKMNANKHHKSFPWFSAFFTGESPWLSLPTYPTPTGWYNRERLKSKSAD